MKTRKLMIVNARAYNNVLTTEHLEKMSDEELMNNCHPSDRLNFERMLEGEHKEKKQ